MNEGWIKLHRRFLQWEWYDDTNTKVLFLHCLLKANHKTKKWRGITIKRGSFITSISHLSKETGLSVRQVRTSLDKLEQTGEIDKVTTSLNTSISISNYDDYQSDDKVPTSERQSSDKVATTTKNEKNVKNEKNIGVPPSKSDLMDYFKERGDMIKEDITLEAENFINHYEERDWKSTSGKRIKDWKRQAATWNNNYKKFNRDRLQKETQQMSYYQEL